MTSRQNNYPMGFMQRIDEILPNSLTVNSNFKNTVNSYNSSDGYLIENPNPDMGVADKLAQELDDVASRRYYILLVKTYSSATLLDALAITKIKYQKGLVKIKKAVYFQGILRNWGVNPKMKENE